MLTELITSKTRIRLLIKFFLNKENTGYLRGLVREFNESSNSIRLELSNLENLNLLKSYNIGNKKCYQVDISNKYYEDIRSLLLKELGIEQIKKTVTEKIEGLTDLFILGDLANGIVSNLIDIVLVGDIRDKISVNNLMNDIENQVNKKIRYVIINNQEIDHFLKNKKHFKI